MGHDEHVIDIHGYDRMYRQAEASLRQSAISDRNKHLILGYRNACLLKNVCKKVRLIRVLGALTLFARLSDKDFDTFARADIEALLARLLAREPAYSPETMGTYRAIIRNFMTWVLVPDEFPTKQPPSMVSWLKASVKIKDKRRLERHALLTPEDVARLIRATSSARNKAIIASLWESGGRIAEVGNRLIRELVKHQFGYLFDVRGKTGQRSILLVSSAPYLSQWLAVHPFVDDPSAPLWVYDRPTKGPRHLVYAAYRTMLQRCMRQAGINKRIYPHLFRHSRATHCVANGLMNEQQAKAYFGWSPSSNMIANYAHLTTQDANNAILRENRLVPQIATNDTLAPRMCTACQMSNLPTAPYCMRCNTVLDESVIRAQVTDHHANNAVILQLCKILTEQGLLDQAAAQLQQAGLGPTLRSLARQTQ